MVNHTQMLLAARTKALTLSVCTTGVMSLSATTTGFARASGSFLTDGFAIGMEVVPAGFADNTPDVIVDVQTLAITTANARSAEGSAGSRSLSVGLPLQRAWENDDFTPVEGRPYFEENYLPAGGMIAEGLGTTPRLTVEPMYVLKLFGLAGMRMEALSIIADALLTLFAPETEMTLTNGDKLRVRGKPGPWRDQLTQARPGWAYVSVSVPLRLYTLNSI